MPSRLRALPTAPRRQTCAGGRRGPRAASARLDGRITVTADYAVSLLCPEGCHQGVRRSHGRPRRRRAADVAHGTVSPALLALAKKLRWTCSSGAGYLRHAQDCRRSGHSIRIAHFGECAVAASAVTPRYATGSSCAVEPDRCLAEVASLERAGRASQRCRPAAGRGATAPARTPPGSAACFPGGPGGRRLAAATRRRGGGIPHGRGRARSGPCTPRCG